MTRATSLLALAVISGPAYADLGAARRFMEPAMQDLAAQRELTVQLVGTEKEGNTTTKISVLTSFRIFRDGNREVPQIEILNFRDGRLRTRIVGDGVTLWSYDVVRNEYSSAKYGSHDGAPPAGALGRMFRLVQQRSTGPSAFSTRIYTDAFLSSAGGWTPWFPTGDVTVGGGEILVHRVTPTSNETVNYSFAAQPDGQVHLGSSVLDSRRWLGDRWLTTQYEATVWRGYVPADADFGFVPPRTAKPVSSTTAGG